MRRGKKDKKNDKVDDSWLLPYSDMLTLLLALFIVLFAMSEVDVQKFEKLANIFQTEFITDEATMDSSRSIVPEELPVREEDFTEKSPPDEEENKKNELLAALEYEKLKETQKQIDAYIKENHLTETLETELTGEGLLVTVRTDVTFDSGSAEVKKQGQKIGKEIASFLNTEPPHEVIVNGHADDKPVHNSAYASNWELSSMRAIEFMYILLEESELDPEWFSARGYGEYQPAVANKNKENRAINRRVEVLIQPNYDINHEMETDEDEAS